MACPPFPRTACLDLFHDRRVESDAAVEQEIATLDRSEADAVNRTTVDGVEQDQGSIGRVVGKTEYPGEHIG